MVFSLLSSCWRYYFHIEEPAREEESPCEEEEEEVDPTCWVLGEMLLFYCLTIALLKMLYHGLEWMHENHDGGILTSHCWIKGKKDPSRKGSHTEDKDAGCTCCWACGFGLRGLLRKLFGEQRKAPAGSSLSSISLERRLSKRLSKLSQQTFCDSDSSETGSLASRPASWRASRTEDSLSASSLKERKKRQAAEAPGSRWAREQPCLRCKAKRTKEWLARHFFEEEPPPQES
ncbi:UNVERIFIED_CONTAM: hypothetical protein K2H54_077131 [Gekko kuhli]